jgi:hypothetical protein
MKKAIIISALAIAACVLTSCGSGITGTFHIPLPDDLGGGSIPITISPQK